MFHTITKFLDEPYINFVIKNNGLQGLREPIFNMLRPLLPIDDNTLISGFSTDSKITNGSKTHIQRNKAFKNYLHHYSLYCVMIFLNDCYNGGNVKLYTVSNNNVICEIKPKKGDCLIFDNNMYYSHDQYEPTTRADRMILKTFIMGITTPKSPQRCSSPTSPLVIPTRKLSIRRELSVSPPSSPIFEFSPIASPSDLSPIVSPDTQDNIIDVRTRTLSNPELPICKLGNHRLTSNSMTELPSITPVSSPTNYLPSSQSDMEKSTIYKRLSKLYKKK